MDLDQLEKELEQLGDELDELIWKLRDKKEAYEKVKRIVDCEKTRRQNLEHDFKILETDQQKTELDRLKNILEQMIRDQEVEMQRDYDPEDKIELEKTWDEAIKEMQKKIKILEAVN